MKTKSEIIRENDVVQVLLRLQDNVLILLAVLFALGLGLVGFLGYARFYKYPVAQALAANDAQAVCAPIALDEPSVSQARVRDFASQVATQLNTFDFFNWRTQLNAVFANSFTPRARDQYRAALQESGRLNKVVEQFQVVSAAVRAPPDIRKEGVLNEVYRWQVRVPMAVFYRTSTETRRETRMVEMVLIRVPSSPVNPNGIAVDEILTSPATSDEIVR